MIPLAMMAFITPLFAAIAMPISSLLVIGNAARIRTLFRSPETRGPSTGEQGEGVAGEWVAGER
jgi:Cu2+-exporting ATPase